MSVNKVILGNETLLDLTNDTVTPSSLLKGVTATDASGTSIVGTLAAGVPFGRCNATSTATAFTATVPGITELVDGTAMFLENGVVTSESGFTININGLGAKPVYNNLTAATRDTTIFNVAYTMLFIYDEERVSGGCWVCYRGYDSNTNTIGYQLRTNSTLRPAADKGYRYRLWFTSLDGSSWVPANTSTSTNNTAKRTPNARVIDPFGEIVYNSTNGTVNAGENLAAATCWQQYTVSLGYSFNDTGAALTLSYPDPVYVQCAPQSGGGVKMEDVVQALPSSADGKVYIYLGMAYSATSIELSANHPVYQYADGAIRLFTNAASVSVPTKTSDLTNDSGFITGYTETDPTVPAWAKASSKPSYTASEVGAVPTSRKVNGKALSADVTLSASDVGALPDSTSIPSKTSDLTNDSGFITGYTETDPTVPSWAKAASKPSYTASEVGAVPTTRTVNGKALSANVTLSASDVGALPSSTSIPSKTSDLTNDSGFITDAGVTKVTTTAGAHTVITNATGAVSMKIPTKTSHLTNDSGFITGYTETDPTVPAWAKAASKPSYTASEVGAVPTTRTVNGKALSANVTLSASDVGALPDSTSIPSKTSDLTNDSGFLTSIPKATDSTIGGIIASQTEGFSVDSLGYLRADRASATSDGFMTSTNYSKLSALPTATELATDYQATLVSGTNIKTINNESLLGSGNITISGGSTPTAMTEAEIQAAFDIGWPRPAGYEVTFILTNPISEAYAYTPCLVIEEFASTAEDAAGNYSDRTGNTYSIQSPSGTETVTMSSSAAAFTVAAQSSYPSFGSNWTITTTGDVTFAGVSSLTGEPRFLITGDGTVTISGIDYNDD